MAFRDRVKALRFTDEQIEDQRCDVMGLRLFSEVVAKITKIETTSLEDLRVCNRLELKQRVVRGLKPKGGAGPR